MTSLFKPLVSDVLESSALWELKLFLSCSVKGSPNPSVTFISLYSHLMQVVWLKD